MLTYRRFLGQASTRPRIRATCTSNLIDTTKQVYSRHKLNPESCLFVVLFSTHAIVNLITLCAMVPSTLIQALLLTLSFVFLHIFLTAVYNIYFHPLAKFPGPKLAAASKLYEFCYDVLFFQGQFYNEIHRMHKVYGKSQSQASLEA